MMPFRPLLLKDRIQAAAMAAQSPGQSVLCSGGRLCAITRMAQSRCDQARQQWMQTQFAHILEFRISTAASAYSFSSAWVVSADLDTALQ